MIGGPLFVSNVVLVLPCAVCRSVVSSFPKGSLLGSPLSLVVSPFVVGFSCRCWVVPCRPFFVVLL